jgi:beta-xylosidase
VRALRVSIILIAAVVLCGYAPPDETAAYVSKVWVADKGDGTYRNPVLYADYSDPDVLRVGDDFYMTSSSFTCVPGLPILHSKDLVNWTIIGHALKKQVPEEVYARPQQGKGVWAPSLRYRAGSFYIYYGDPDYGLYMVKTKDPAGDWDQPVLALAGKGLIDPCPLWDDDGKAYLVHAWAASRAGVSSLLTVHRMSPEGTQVLDEGRHVFDGHDHHPTCEGPKFYKRNGYYYIFTPAGGVPRGWQLVLRSRNIYGPYEEKIVLAQGSTNVNGPHQGGWVDTPSGESWFLHFQELGAYGRVVHLQPVNWVDDWPLMGLVKDGSGKGEPVLSHKKPDLKGGVSIRTPQESDEFNGTALGLQWQWNANPRITWYALIPGSGHLRLFSIKKPEGARNLWEVPNLLLQKLPAPDFTATAKVRFTEASADKQAGLIVMGRSYSHLSLSRTQDGLKLAQVVCPNAAGGGKEAVTAELPLKDHSLYLRVKVTSPNAHCRFSYSLDGIRFTGLGEEFAAQPGGWIGAKVGLFSVSEPAARDGGYADFDWFRIE